MVAKLINNLVAASAFVATRIAIYQANKLNINPEELLIIMNKLSGKTWLSENFSEIDYVKENFDQDDTVGIFQKDPRCFLKTYQKDQLAKNIDRKILPGHYFGLRQSSRIS